MKLIIKNMIAITLLLCNSACEAQAIKNSKTDTAIVYGECSMCRKAIEKAGNVKKIAIIDWNQDTQVATLTYNAQKTSKSEILKRIALAGYDNEAFSAPPEAYAKLETCCQYERKAKVAPNTPVASKTDAQSVITEIPQLKAVFDNYFALKDALVKTDGNTVATKAKELLLAINSVKMEKLAADEHTVWMKVLKDLVSDAEHINETKEITHQRDHFITLSKNMYALMKISKQETPTYYQFCPMANDGKGANWLSKENAVKNPYYGSMMLSCGKTVETIK